MRKTGSYHGLTITVTFPEKCLFSIWLLLILCLSSVSQNQNTELRDIVWDSDKKNKCRSVFWSAPVKNEMDCSLFLYLYVWTMLTFWENTKPEVFKIFLRYNRVMEVKLSYLPFYWRSWTFLISLFFFVVTISGKECIWSVYSRSQRACEFKYWEERGLKSKISQVPGKTSPVRLWQTSRVLRKGRYILCASIAEFKHCWCRWGKAKNK